MSGRAGDGDGAAHVWRIARLGCGRCRTLSRGRAPAGSTPAVAESHGIFNFFERDLPWCRSSGDIEGAFEVPQGSLGRSLIRAVTGTDQRLLLESIYRLIRCKSLNARNCSLKPTLLGVLILSVISEYATLLFFPTRSLRQF